MKKRDNGASSASGGVPNAAQRQAGKRGNADELHQHADGSHPDQLSALVDAFWSASSFHADRRSLTVGGVLGRLPHLTACELAGNDGRLLD